MKNSTIQKAVLLYLQKYHCGAENAVSSLEIQAAFGLKGGELRRIINALRCAAYPICSDATGYYYAARESEVRATIAQLNGRISKISGAADGLERSVSDAGGNCTSGAK